MPLIQLQTCSQAQQALIEEEGESLEKSTLTLGYNIFCKSSSKLSSKRRQAFTIMTVH